MRLRERQSAHRRLSNGGINLTPLIDVVFQLLIFFMLSSNFILQPGIKVDLPEAKGVKLQEQEELIITITKDREVFLNDKRVSMNELGPALQARAAGRAKRNVFIKPDKTVPTGVLVEAMGIAKEAGFDSIGIATEPRSSR